MHASLTVLISPLSSIFLLPLVPKHVRHLIQQTQKFTGADANMRERYCMQIPITTGGKHKIQSGEKKVMLEGV